MGLSFGLATSFILFSWIFHELNYDTFFEDHDRIYRVVIQNEHGEGRAAVSPAVKRVLIDNIPEVKASARLFRTGPVKTLRYE